jgi:hypothetical protein
MLVYKLVLPGSPPPRGTGKKVSNARAQPLFWLREATRLCNGREESRQNYEII